MIEIIKSSGAVSMGRGASKVKFKLKGKEHHENSGSVSESMQ